MDHPIAEGAVLLQVPLMESRSFGGGGLAWFCQSCVQSFVPAQNKKGFLRESEICYRPETGLSPNLHQPLLVQTLHRKYHSCFWV